ncbi:MAG: hypothetical protein KGL39_39935 [Patescibacteria group bacterium]|nr:hypothetical protein [Patescibacteria group bacterium]
MSKIDEKAIASVQDKYAKENGKYRDISIRMIIEAYEAAKASEQQDEYTIEDAYNDACKLAKTNRVHFKHRDAEFIVSPHRLGKKVNELEHQLKRESSCPFTEHVSFWEWQPMETAPMRCEVWVAYPHADGHYTVFMATKDKLGWDSQFHWRLHGQPVAWMHTNRPLPPKPISPEPLEQPRRGSDDVLNCLKSKGVQFNVN